MARAPMASWTWWPGCSGCRRTWPPSAAIRTTSPSSGTRPVPAAVNFLAASPLSKGLFHRVIAMSGASFTPLQTSAQGAFGMSIPTLQLAEATGSAFLAKLGVKNIAEARKLERGHHPGRHRRRH